MKRRAGGFSVVEILVAVAVLAVLVSLALPAIAAAQERSRAVSCLGRMREIGHAVLLHAQDNQGRFPRSSHSAGANREVVWTAALAPYLGAPPGGATTAWFNREVRCPADTNRPGAPSYGLNVFFELQAGDSYIGRPATWRTMSQVPSPARTILVAEAGNAAGGMTADHFMCHQWSGIAAARNAVASTRHNGRSNYLFVDGHVASLAIEETFTSRDKNLWNPSVAGQP